MRGSSVHRPRARRALAATIAATLVTSLAVALNPVTAAAVPQTLRNGCNSEQAYSGDLTSPEFDSPVSGGQVTFHGWFEGESVSPSSFDRATVFYSIDGVFPVDPPFGEFGDLKSFLGTPPNSGGNDDIGYSNNGTGMAPSFQAYTFDLPVEAQNETGVRIHFRFGSGDSSYNGFRGFAVDDVSIDTDGSPLTETFETSSSLAWTFDPASGSGAPFWHVLDNPETVSIKNPEITPDLVTLDPFESAPDSGALPEAFEGAAVAWFGDDASGTFCGPGFGDRFISDTQPPETTITAGPAASTVSPDASLAFTSSEPGSSFECRVDGAAFGSCSGPGQTHAVTGLSQAPHTFQVRATDDSGNTDPTPASHSWTVVKPPVVVDPPLTLADLPKPTLGEDVNVQAKSGVVLVGVRTGAASSGRGARASQKGIKFVPLAEARQIPVGSLLDTSKGVVTLQSARNKSGARQNGNFSKGLFQVLQARKAKGLTELKLKGSSFKSCKPAKKRGKRRGKARGRRSGVEAVGSAGRTIRRLRGNANGRFRTRGRRSAATVRGTIWDVTDRCDGTLTKVKRGKVAVRDFRLKKTIVLRSGKSYFAR